MHRRHLFRILLGAGLLLGASLQAQVAVYRLSFEETGDTINYRPYQNGYYIAPIEGGSGSLILTLSTGGLRQYFAYETFGEVFVALSGDKKKMVLSATAANDVSTTVFYALGTADKEIDVESRNATSKVKVATKMQGYAVSADSEQDLPFSGTGTSVGVAGASLLTAKYDENLSETAIKDGVSVATEVDIIIAQLTASNYVDGKPTTTPTTTTPTTTTPTTTTANSVTSPTSTTGN